MNSDFSFSPQIGQKLPRPGKIPDGIGYSQYRPESFLARPEIFFMIAFAHFASVTHLRIMEHNDDAKKRPEWPEIVIDGKYVRQLDLMIRTLRPRDAHGNRVLHLDDVLVCYLLAFFNPSIRFILFMHRFRKGLHDLHDMPWGASSRGQQRGLD